MTSDWIGYLALSINLVSMTMKNVIYLRFLSLVANLIYMIYGIILNAVPLVIGGGIAVLIHTTHLVKLTRQTFQVKNEKYHHLQN